MAPRMGAGRPSRTAEMLPIAAGSLTMIDSTLFLSFAGAMADSSSCPGAGGGQRDLLEVASVQARPDGGHKDMEASPDSHCLSAFPSALCADT